MKHIVLLISLLIISTRAAMIHPSTFPSVEGSKFSIQWSKEAFSLACGQTWKILSAIQIPSAALFPVELFALQDDPEFEVVVKCSTDLKSMNVTFLATTCEPMYDGLTKNPIVFQIKQNQPNSSQVDIQLISSCPYGSSTPSTETAHISKVSDKWYLVHRSVLCPVENNFKFGLIVFIRRKITGKNYQQALRGTLNHASATFFNRKLIDFVPYNLFKMGNKCDLSLCYGININQSTNTPFTTATNNQDTKMQLNDMEMLIFLLVPVIIGLLLGMIIFYNTISSNITSNA